ncbi:MAG: thioredoxin domain-containing protein [Firmicutes bacterium]|nr:thioredoxin domain-containing protein [Bacillota bacterium]
MSKELDLPIKWHSIEVHPDTPPSGRSVREMLGNETVDRIFEYLEKMGEPYGLKFSGYDLLPNSRKAILLGEYIKLNHPEHEEAYREAVFRSYSTESQDIGKEEVLSNILQEFGLKPEIASLAFNDPASKEQMSKNARSAAEIKLTALPTIIIGNEKIEGARSYSRLLAAAQRALDHKT